MKVVGIRKETTEFNPISIKLTFDTPEEFYAIYSMFSHMKLVNFLNANGIDDDIITDTLEHELKLTNPDMTLDYHDTFTKLCEKMKA